MNCEKKTFVGVYVEQRLRENFSEEKFEVVVKCWRWERYHGEISDLEGR
jgi:hypothetical protein